jgi:hypothetical protein
MQQTRGPALDLQQEKEVKCCQCVSKRWSVAAGQQVECGSRTQSWTLKGWQMQQIRGPALIIHLFSAGQHVECVSKR